MGMSRSNILEQFYTYDDYEYNLDNKSWSTIFKPEKYKRPIKLQFDLIDKKNIKKVLKKGEKLNFILAQKLKEKGLNNIIVSEDEIIGKYTNKDLKVNNTELIIKSGFNITKEILEKIVSSKINRLKLANVDSILKGPYIFETIKVDKNLEKNTALADIYKVLRPGEPPTPEVRKFLKICISVMNVMIY